MKYLLLITFTIVIASSIVYFFTNKTTQLTNFPPKNVRIVAFGDSLAFGQGSTAGNDFVSVLERTLNRDIVNLGVSGNTTADGLTRVSDVTKLDPGIVILLLGGNDYLRHTDEKVTRANLATLITSFQKSGAVVVLLGVRGGIVGDTRASMYEELSDTYGTVYVSNILDGVFLKPDLMFDSIHPNDKGYAIIATRVAEIFRENNL